MLVLARSRRLKELFSSSISNGGFFISSQVLYLSTISSSNPGEAPKPHIMVDFLINSIGFTTEAAISASSKVPYLQSTNNPELVINIFREYGLDKLQMREIISSVPKILNCYPKKTLEPKIRVLREYGFSGSDLADLIKTNPNVFTVGLHTRIIPVIDFIRRFTGSDEEAIEAIKKSKRLFTAPHSLERLSANVLQLQNRGISDEQIVRIITKYPRVAATDPSKFETRLLWIVEKLMIPENSPMFVYAIYAISKNKFSTIDKKLKLLGSYKWSEEDIATFGRSNPFNLALSEAKIRDGLNFFMKELGYTPADLVHANLLRLSLETKVKPRYKVLEILKDKKLVSSKPNLASLVRYSEPKFLKFLYRFEDKLPGLVEIYANSIKETPSLEDVALKRD